MEVVKLNLGRDSEARFGQYLNFKFGRNADVWMINFEFDACLNSGDEI